MLFSLLLALLLLTSLGHPTVALGLAAGAGEEPAAAFMRSPLTLLIVGTLAGYYVAYAAGLIRWKRRTALAAGAG